MMSGARRCVVYAALAVICAGSLVDLALAKRHTAAFVDRGVAAEGCPPKLARA